MAGEFPPTDSLAAGLLRTNPLEGVSLRTPVAERMAHYNCPGMSVCVIRDGKVGEARGYGLIETCGAPVLADTVFAGASLSKPIAAVLALQLVEQGAVTLDRPINGFLKRWQVAENAFTRDQPVTLRHLLSHRAGTTVPGFGSFPEGSRPPTLVEILSGRPPSPTPVVEVDKTPGGSVRYSGGGTQIVQLMLEDVTGLPFSDLARERIFEPLAMNRSTFDLPLSEAWKAISAVGHDTSGAPIAPRFTFTPQLAAGGVYTTAPDYARFLVEFRNAWLGRGNVLMSQASARLMTERQGGGQFGLGWEVSTLGTSTRIGHGGSNEGYQCASACYLEEGAGAVVMTNGLRGILLHGEVMTTLADAHRWGGRGVTLKKAREVPSEQQAAYIGLYDVVSGLAPTQMEIWSENGRLHTHTKGLILPPRPIYLDPHGRLISEDSRTETRVSFGRDGRAEGLVVCSEAGVELIRAVRRLGDS